MMFFRVLPNRVQVWQGGGEGMVCLGSEPFVYPHDNKVLKGLRKSLRALEGP